MKALLMTIILEILAVCWGGRVLVLKELAIMRHLCLLPTSGLLGIVQEITKAREEEFLVLTFLR